MLNRRQEIERELQGLDLEEQVEWLKDQLIEASPELAKIYALYEADWPLAKAGAYMVVAMSTGRIQSRDRPAYVAGMQFTDPRTVDSVIKRIRNVLRENDLPLKADDIVTIYGFGYRIKNANKIAWPWKGDA